MWEHRTIEQAVGLLEKALEKVGSKGRLSRGLLESIVDFFRMYADRTHHGKEEDILFKRLAEKPVSEEHRTIMDGLKKDHVRGRELVKQIDDTIEAYTRDDADSIKVITGAIKSLLELYPRHIEKEDKHFFYPAMDYFTTEERGEMLREFYEFDRQIIHEKYKAVLADMEKAIDG
jgi:hemerythrin-like domain-containing protein